MAPGQTKSTPDLKLHQQIIEASQLFEAVDLTMVDPLQAFASLSLNELSRRNSNPPIGTPNLVPHQLLNQRGGSFRHNTSSQNAAGVNPLRSPRSPRFFDSNPPRLAHKSKVLVWRIVGASWCLLAALVWSFRISSVSCLWLFHIFDFLLVIFFFLKQWIKNIYL